MSNNQLDDNIVRGFIHEIVSEYKTVKKGVNHLSENKTQFFFFGRDTVDFLLMRDTDSINAFICNILFKASDERKSNDGYPKIAMKQLYVVDCDDNSTGNNFSLFFGDEILNSQICFPEMKQLIMSCDWHKRKSRKSFPVPDKKNVFWCDNYDLWTEFLLRQILKKVEDHIKMMFLPIHSLTDFFGEDRHLQDSVIYQYHQKLISFNKKYKKNILEKDFPTFLLDEISEEFNKAERVYVRLKNSF